MATETKEISQVAAQHEEGHAAHPKRPYMAIFWALLILTVIEVSTIFLPPLPENIHYFVIAPFLMLIAVGKAALVAMYYMHLRYDPRGLTVIFLGPFVLAILFVVILVTQYT